MAGRDAGRAETLALQALGWLAADADRLGAFLAASGSSPAALRAGVEDPEFLAAVLDFLLSDEGLLLDFAAAAGRAPQAVAAARAGLPGGDLPHWT